MSVHTVRIKTATKQKNNPSNVPNPGPPDWKPQLLKDRIKQNVFDNLTEVLPGQAQEMKQLSTKMDGSGTDYFQAVRRVDKADSKSKVLDEFENNVAADADWYIIDYHECDHDEPDENRTGCGDWKTERSKGNVPNGV